MPNENRSNISVIDGDTNQVIDTIKLSNGDVSSDVGINPITNRIYVTDINSLSVKVIDGEDNRVIKTIHMVDVPGSFSSRIEVNSLEDRIYVSIASDIHVIDGKTNSVIDKFRVGDNQSDIDINPVTNRIYVSDKSHHSVFIIDGKTNENIDNIRIREFPREIGINPVTNRIYMSNLVSTNINVINGETNQVIDTIDVENKPGRIAINPTTNRIYVTNRLTNNNISVIGGDTNQVIDNIVVGGSLAEVVVNPTTNRIYVANSTKDNIIVIDGEDNNVIDTIDVEGSPQEQEVGINPLTNRIYVVNSSSNNVSVIDGRTNKVIDTILVGAVPRGIGINTITNRIYVANIRSDNVSVIDGMTNQIINTIAVRDFPLEVGVNPNTNRIYVTSGNNDSVGVIDGNTNQIIDNIAVGNSPFGVSANPNTNLIYVANSASGDVTVILDNANEPIAKFSTNLTTGLSPLDVTFTDKSTGDPKSWTWHFGDGEISSEQNPQHIYKNEGNFTVGLMVSNNEGQDWEIKNNLIRVQPAETPKAIFEATPLVGSAPMKVQFEDFSEGSPDSWTWDFGDGNTSRLQKPIHTYNETGSFTVNLTVSNVNDNDSNENINLINVLNEIEPVVDFVAEPLTGFSPLTVKFTSLSSGKIDNLLWDFGDGSTGFGFNPFHTYHKKGTFTVSLTLNNLTDVVSETKTNLIKVLDSGISDLSAAFQARTRIAPPSANEEFKDLSSGKILGWLWDFGDGNTSTDRNPKHKYNSEGVFTISLTVFNNDGEMDTVTRKAYVEIKENTCVADFDVEVTEVDIRVCEIITFTTLS